MNPAKKRRKRPRRFIYSNVSIILLLLVTLFLGYQAFGLREKRDMSEAKRAEAAAEFARALKEEESLRIRNQELQTAEGRERALRERFNVVKEGEGVIYIVEEDRPIGAGIVLDASELTQESFLKKLLNFFAF